MDNVIFTNGFSKISLPQPHAWSLRPLALINPHFRRKFLAAPVELNYVDKKYCFKKPPNQQNIEQNPMFSSKNARKKKPSHAGPYPLGHFTPPKKQNPFPTR